MGRLARASGGSAPLDATLQIFALITGLLLSCTKLPDNKDAINYEKPTLTTVTNPVKPCCGYCAGLPWHAEDGYAEAPADAGVHATGRPETTASYGKTATAV
jgi:hypothetical protein